MSKVIFDISISVDGFIRAANPTRDEPLGVGGERLHEWTGDPQNQEYLEKALADLGAVITGRANYDDSLPWWGANGPTGPARRPVVVVTHDPPGESPAGGVYRFADGVESALRQARLLAGDKDVTVMGGASIGQQFIAAGLVDEISLHIVPVLFGSGTRMFENLHMGHAWLEPIEVIHSSAATHLRYRLGKGQPVDR